LEKNFALDTFVSRSGERRSLFQHEGCGLLQNRDKTGATNIGRQFARLIEGKDPLRVMNEDGVEYNILNRCVECHE
jgi:hypothetical protein